MPEENKFERFEITPDEVDEEILGKIAADLEAEELTYTMEAITGVELEITPVPIPAPTTLPEPETDGPIALMERGWEIMLAAHGGNINVALRSWRELARQWREDCHAWAEANPTADN